MEKKLSWFQRRRMVKDARIFIRQKDFLTAADLYLEAGKLKKAQGCFLLGEAPLKAGDVALSRGKVLEAARIFEKAGALLRAAEAYHLLGDVALEQSMYKAQADHYLGERKEMLAAELFEKAGDLAKAAELFRHTGFYDRAHRALLALGREDHAAEAFEKHLIHEGPSMSESDRNRQAGECARLYARVGDREAAVRVCRHFGLIEEAATYLLDLHQWEKAAMLLRENGAVEKAAALFRQNGQERTADMMLAEFYRDTGRYAEAAVLFERHQEKYSAAVCLTESGAFAAAARLFFSEGQFLDAANSFGQAGLTRDAADAFERSGDIDAALHIAEADDDHERIARLSLQRGDYYRAGMAWRNAGRVKEAISAFQRVKPGDDGFIEVQDEIVTYFIDQGLIDAARRKLGEIAAERPVNEHTVGLFYRLAILEADAGRLSEARQWLEKIVQFDINYRDAMQRLVAMPSGEPSN